MEISTALWIALALWIGLFVPYAIWYIRRGRAHGHTWFTWWKPRGHSDIGPDVPVGCSRRACLPTDSTGRRRCAGGSLLIDGSLVTR